MERRREGMKKEKHRAEREKRNNEFYFLNRSKNTQKNIIKPNVINGFRPERWLCIPRKSHNKLNRRYY